MNTRIKQSGAIVALAGCLCLGGHAFADPAPAASAPPPSAPQTVAEFLSYDGLQKINVRDMQMVYARPGASLAAYTKVMIDPITVKFAKDWSPKSQQFGDTMTQRDRDQIKTELAKALLDAFEHALKSKNGYEIVTAPGPDVLEIQATILNLKVTAPIATQGMSSSWVRSAGQATLVAELADSQSGQILVRAIDSQLAQGGAAVMNRDSAEQVCEQWASILRRGLDRSREIGKK